MIAQLGDSDTKEDAVYLSIRGDEIPEELKLSPQRLETIKTAKRALEVRELVNNPGKTVDDWQDKVQISFADWQARIMGSSGQFDYSYNGQISVDSYPLIIVGQHVSQCANDKQEVESALLAIFDNTGQVPNKMSLDNGYASGDNFHTLFDAGVDAYIAVV